MNLNVGFLCMAVVALVAVSLPAGISGDEPPCMVEAMSFDGQHFCLRTPSSTGFVFSVYSVEGEKIGETAGSACAFGNFRKEAVFVTASVKRNTKDEDVLSVSMVSINTFEPVVERIEIDVSWLSSILGQATPIEVFQIGKISDSFGICMSNGQLLMVDFRQEKWHIVVPGPSKVLIMDELEFSKLDFDAKDRIQRIGYRYSLRVFTVSDRATVVDFVGNRGVCGDVAAIISGDKERPAVEATIECSFLDRKQIVEYRNRVYFPSTRAGRINAVATPNQFKNSFPEDFSQLIVVFEIDGMKGRRLPDILSTELPHPIDQVMHCSSILADPKSVVLFVSSFMKHPSGFENFLYVASNEGVQDKLQLPESVRFGEELKITDAGNRLLVSGLFEDKPFLAILETKQLSWSEVDLERLY